MSNSLITVVHSNDLIDASYSLTIDEMRLLSFVSTLIDSRKQNIGEIKVYPSSFSKAFKLDHKNIHRNLIGSIKSLANKSVTLPMEGGKCQVLPWLARGIYERQPNEEAYVSVEFSKYIEPYLFELKERFTIIDFDVVSRLNTPFSYRLYQWLMKAKKLDKAKDGESIVVELEINWIKEQAGFNGLYNRWVHFRDRVIQPAVDLLNSKSDISLIWKPTKQGRKVHAIQFNYVVEAGAFAKPIRPRLYRRPKVVKNSHEEGVWMRKNLALILGYKKELKAYDPTAKLDIKDVERIAEYSSICDSVTHEKAKKELLSRKKKNA
jgi:plasmid replication initiation protein